MCFTPITPHFAQACEPTALDHESAVNPFIQGPYSTFYPTVNPFAYVHKSDTQHVEPSSTKEATQEEKKKRRRRRRNRKHKSSNHEASSPSTSVNSTPVSDSSNDESCTTQSEPSPLEAERYIEFGKNKTPTMTIPCKYFLQGQSMRRVNREEQAVEQVEESTQMQTYVDQSLEQHIQSLNMSESEEHTQEEISQSEEHSQIEFEEHTQDESEEYTQDESSQHSQDEFSQENKQVYIPTSCAQEVAREEFEFEWREAVHYSPASASSNKVCSSLISKFEQSPAYLRASEICSTLSTQDVESMKSTGVQVGLLGDEVVLQVAIQTNDFNLDLIPEEIAGFKTQIYFDR